MALDDLSGPDLTQQYAALCEAVRNGHVSTVRQLMKDQSYESLINMCDESENTPLFIAVSARNMEMAVSLIESGALIYHKNSVGTTPVDCWPLLEEVQERLVQGTLAALASQPPSSDALSCVYLLCSNEETSRLFIEEMARTNAAKSISMNLSQGGSEWHPFLHRMIAFARNDSTMPKFISHNGFRILVGAFSPAHTEMLDQVLDTLIYVIDRDKLGEFILKLSGLAEELISCAVQTDGDVRVCSLLLMLSRMNESGNRILKHVNRLLKLKSPGSRYFSAAICASLSERSKFHEGLNSINFMESFSNIDPKAKESPEVVRCLVALGRKVPTSLKEVDPFGPSLDSLIIQAANSPDSDTGYVRAASGAAIVRALFIHDTWRDLLTVFLQTCANLFSRSVMVRMVVYNAVFNSNRKQRCKDILAHWIDLSAEDFSTSSEDSLRGMIIEEEVKAFVDDYWNRKAAEAEKRRIQTKCHHETEFSHLKDLVLNGTLPVMLEEAIRLGSLQCQVENPMRMGKRNKGSFRNVLVMSKLKSTLPVKYRWTMGLDRKVQEQQVAFSGLSSTEAKGLYVRLCEALDTYGYSFFDARVLTPKLGPRRKFGFSPNSMIILDPETNATLFKLFSENVTNVIFEDISIRIECPQLPGGRMSLQFANHNCINTIKGVYDSTRSRIPSMRKPLERCQCPPDPLLKSREVGPESWTLLEILEQPEELARQLTLMEWEFFSRLSPETILESGEASAASSAFHFNTMSVWVSNMVVYEENPETRSAVLRGFVALLKYLRQYNNFNGMMEVISGLNSTPVRRLTTTWASLSKDELEIFANYETLMSPASNFSAYRKAYSMAIGAKIPYLGVLRKDITFANEGLFDYATYGLINITKRRRMSSILESAAQLTEDRYRLVTLPDIRSYLEAELSRVAKAIKIGTEEEDRKRFEKALEVQAASEAPLSPKFGFRTWKHADLVQNMRKSRSSPNLLTMDD